MRMFNSFARIHAITLFLVLVSPNAIASFDVYGRIAVDFKSISKTLSGTQSDIDNNESKAGLKGDFLLNANNDIRVVYQIEYGFDPVDGKERGEEGTFKQRNTFVGLQSNYGTLFVGTHDSALKRSQLKVDLFNDLSPDINNLLHGENRLEDFIGYTTPILKDAFSATMNSIKNPSSSGKKYQSYSIDYALKKIQAAFALDDEINGYKSKRFSFLYSAERYKIGMIFQESDQLGTGIIKTGGVISFAQKINLKGMLKIQYASSSMKIASGKHSTIGYDYQLKKDLKFFTYYSKLQSNLPSKNKNIFSLGLEYRF